MPAGLRHSASPFHTSPLCNIGIRPHKLTRLSLKATATATAVQLSLLSSPLSRRRWRQRAL